MNTKLDLEYVRRIAVNIGSPAWQAQVTLLCDEVERLRKALTEIAECRKMVGRFDGRMALIARKALES